MNIIKSLSNDSDLKDLSRDVIEMVIDEGLKEGLLKEIPIVKTVYSLSKAYNTITDKIHLKKVLMVLLEMKDLSNKERDNFIDELKDKYSSGTDKLMLAISNLETYPKCAVFGKLSLLKATGQITLDEYLRITKIIQDCYLDDLNILKNIKVDIKESVHSSTGEYYSIDYNGIMYEDGFLLVNIGILNQFNTNTPIEYSSWSEEVRGGEADTEFDFTTIGQVIYKHHKFLLEGID